LSYSIDGEELVERLKWLIKLRWIGIIGVFGVTNVIRELAFLSFSLVPVYAILGFASFYNLIFLWLLKFRKQPPRTLAVTQIFLDQFTLSLAMYFSGGCDSPFLYFFIFHIAISGIMLPWKYTVAFSVLAVVFPTSVMGLIHYNFLPHYGIFRNEPVIFTDLAVIGSYGSAFVGTIFLTAYFVTYLSRRLHWKNEEVRRLYSLSERLRSSIRLDEVIAVIEKELCGFVESGRSLYLPLEKNMRALLFRTPEGDTGIPLVDGNSFTEALMNCSAMTLDIRTITSNYEKEVLKAMSSETCLILPVTTSSLGPCYKYLNCTDTQCRAYGNDTGRCWQLSKFHCNGTLFRNSTEKLNFCLACDLFRPIGVFVLDLGSEF